MRRYIAFAVGTVTLAAVLAIAGFYVIRLIELKKMESVPEVIDGTDSAKYYPAPPASR